jgi:hypothetical protein
MGHHVQGLKSLANIACPPGNEFLFVPFVRFVVSKSIPQRLEATVMPPATDLTGSSRPPLAMLSSWRTHD